jgi:plastocyanin
MTIKYRLIHVGWTGLTAALTLALAPALTGLSAAQGGEPVKKIEGDARFRAATSTVSPQPKPPAADAATEQVKIDNFSFTPNTLTVPVGAMVTWTNKDDEPHTVVSTKKQFASRALDTDEQFSYRFTAPGTYSYYCSVHPMMTGTVTVK